MKIDETQIKQILREKGISQKHLAKHLGVSLPTVARRLKDNAFTYEQLVEIGQLIGADLNYADKETGKVLFTLESFTPAKDKAKREREKEREGFRCRLEQAMREKNKKASPLAKDIDVSRQSMSVYLRGKGTPRAETIKKLAKALEVSPEWLAGEE